MAGSAEKQIEDDGIFLEIVSACSREAPTTVHVVVAYSRSRSSIFLCFVLPHFLSQLLASLAWRIPPRKSPVRVKRWIVD